MTRRKLNITPADIDTYYINGQDVYRLVDCETELHATMEFISSGEHLLKPISEFANFVRLRPEHPIVKPPAPRKTRKDKGIRRAKKQSAEEVATTIIGKVMPEQASTPSGVPVVKIKAKKQRGTKSEPTQEKNPTLVDISTFSSIIGLDDELNTLRLGEVAVGCKILREGALELLGLLGIDQQYIEDAPDSEGKRLLMNILNPTPSEANEV